MRFIYFLSRWIAGGGVGYLEWENDTGKRVKCPPRLHHCDKNVGSATAAFQTLEDPIRDGHTAFVLALWEKKFLDLWPEMKLPLAKASFFLLSQLTAFRRVLNKL